jgi:hypothetical protein
MPPTTTMPATTTSTVVPTTNGGTAPVPTVVAPAPSNPSAPGPNYELLPNIPAITSISVTANSCVVRWTNALPDVDHGSPLGADFYVDGQKRTYVQWWDPTLTTPITIYALTGLAPGTHAIQVDNFDSGGEGTKSPVMTCDLRTAGSTPPSTSAP